MAVEHSCGAVVSTRTADGLRYVVICQTNGDWGFPKGHMEPGETERQTAAREIFEEVGLKVTLLDGFRQEITYRMPNQNEKHCVYFLAMYAEQEIRCQESEVREARLMTCAEAMAVLSYPDAQQLLAQADRFLRQE